MKKKIIRKYGFCSISNCIWWEDNEEAYISPNLVRDGYGSWNRKKIKKHIHRFIKKTRSKVLRS